MADFGTVTPITLDEDRKLELEGIMAKANRALASAVCVVYQTDVTQIYYRRIRDDHLKYKGTDKDPLRSLPFARKAVESLREVEEEIIAGFIRTTFKLCASFEFANQKKVPGVELSDYIQESEWAIWDAMYSYRGDRRFSTFVFWVVKNRLINYVRQESKRAETLHLGDSPETPSEDKTDHVLEMMRQSIEQANLTPIERELVEAHMAGKRGYRSELERSKKINPDNGKPYTRAWLGQIFKVACEKCRQTFEQKAA